MVLNRKCKLVDISDFYLADEKIIRVKNYNLMKAGYLFLQNISVKPNQDEQKLVTHSSKRG